MTELDELRQVIDESHRMIVDEDTGRRWKELYQEAEAQISKLKDQRRVGAEAVKELFGHMVDLNFVTKSWPWLRCYDCICTRQELCIVRIKDAPIWRKNKWIFPRTLCRHKRSRD